MTIQEITVTELKLKLTKMEFLFLLDIREPHEVQIGTIDGATFIPMNLIPLYLDQIPDETDIVIYCHHGVRSLNVARYLIENGFDSDHIYSLAGGIEAWSLIIDPSIARY